jgi:hypothetical protein
MKTLFASVIALGLIASAVPASALTIHLGGGHHHHWHHGGWGWHHHHHHWH